MPIYEDLRRSCFDSMEAAGGLSSCDETFVADARNGMRPTQLVDNKFGVALGRELDREAFRTRPGVSGKPHLD